MDFLDQLMQGSDWPLYTAFILGLMTAISPCPLATNISAIGFLSRNISQKHLILRQSLIYTLGRTLAYVSLAGIFLLGTDQAAVQSVIARYGERLLGPLLIIIGVFMLDLIRIRFPGLTGITSKVEERSKSGGFWSVLLLGFFFALAFCPYSGVLYFLFLIPLTLGSPEGLLLPLTFSIATALPVILFAILVAYMVSAAGKFYNNIKIFEYWFRKIVGIIFIAAGVYLIINIYLM